MALVRWEPRSLLGDFQKEFNKLFDQFFSREIDWDTGLERTWFPAVDISEDKDAIVIHADLPGVDQKDVKVTLLNNVLTIRGERKEERKESGRDYHRLERVCGSFQRSFTLPSTVDESKITADYKDGVLTVRLPKSETAKAREIEVKVK